MTLDKQKEIPELMWAEKAAVLLDSKFTLPGTKFRFGLDPIIGLIPVVGDLFTLFISAFLVTIMAKHGASRKLLLIMSLNVIADAIIGTIPMVGSLFDFGFKANTKNIALLKSYYFEGKHQGKGTGIVLLIFACVFIIILFVIWGTYKLVKYLIGFLS
jgi:hypothetical protein